MKKHGVVPCQPRCSSNLAPGTTTVHPGGRSGVGHASFTAAPSAEDSELRALLVARRDVLKQAVEILTARYVQGSSSPDALIAANVALLEAELQLAGSKEERLLVLQRLRDQHKQLEQQMEEMIQLGVGSQEGCLAAKAARLNVEIELHKARKAE